MEEFARFKKYMSAMKIKIDGTPQSVTFNAENIRDAIECWHVFGDISPLTYIGEGDLAKYMLVDAESTTLYTKIMSRMVNMKNKILGHMNSNHISAGQVYEKYIQTFAKDILGCKHDETVELITGIILEHVISADNIIILNDIDDVILDELRKLCENYEDVTKSKRFYKDKILMVIVGKIFQ